jgi:hypothetical protein
LDIKRRLTARSDRVKMCDLHPTEPWMLASLYNGNVHVWNHETQQLVSTEIDRFVCFYVIEKPLSYFVQINKWLLNN